MQRFLSAGAILIVLAGCSGSSPSPRPATPAAQPAAAAAVAPAATTIDEARSLHRNGDDAGYERSLRSLALSADATTQRHAQTMLALLLVDQKRNDEAAPLLEKAAVSNSEIAPWLRLRLIDLEQARGNMAAAAQVAAQIIATAGDTSAGTIARLRLPAIYARMNDLTQTEAAARQLDAIAIDELSEEDFVDLASNLAASGREDLATTIRMRLLTTYPQGRFTEKVFQSLSKTTGAPLDQLSFDDTIALASKLSRQDRYDQALDLLHRISVRSPEKFDRAAYQSVRIKALFNSRRYTELLAETDATPLTDPPLALLRARAAWRAQRPQDFLTGLRRVEKDFPSSKEAAEAQILRAKYYITDETDYDQSIANLQKALAAGALGNEGENLWTLGWTLTLAQRDDEALEVFDRYVKSFPDGDYKTNSLFWSAKIYARHGLGAERNAKLRQLIAEYPYGYYAYRAREIMGESRTPPPQLPTGNVFPDIDAQVTAANDPRLGAVRELMDVDLPRDATREMKLIAAAHPDNLGIAFTLADVYVQGGEPFKANNILQKRFRNFVRHGGTNLPNRFWQILFPLNYWNSLRGEAARRNVDPYLLASIIRQESGFEPHVVSNAGAVGLMQIMPAEADQIAANAGLSGVTRENLFRPDTNIAVGAAEYSQKLAKMNGNAVLAIAAYNAGEEAVGKWLAHTPIDDLDLFVDSIPYSETRLYVKSVTRNRFEYRRIYEGSTVTGQQYSR